MVKLTDNAITEVKRLLEKQGAKPGVGLRVCVQGGGCSGLSYKLDFSGERKGDSIQDFGGVKIYVDPKSDIYLDGTTVDFVDGLSDRGFRFLNPNSKKSCGCGESFSV